MGNDKFMSNYDDIRDITPAPQTALEKAIVTAEQWRKDFFFLPNNYCGLVIYELLLAAKRVTELEQKLNEWSNKELLGDTECCRLQAAEMKLTELEQRLKEVEKEKENEQLKAAIQLMEHGKYGRVDLTNQLSTLRTEYRKVLEAVADLVSICTCARPAVLTTEGGTKAPGPHTSKCVHSIAKKIIPPPPPPPQSQQ